MKPILSRRSFLVAATSAAVAGVGGGSKPVTAFDGTKMRPKLAIATYSYWHFRSRKVPIETVMDKAARESSSPAGDAMTKKTINDSVAYIRGLAEMRGRNADWAEEAVREAVDSRLRPIAMSLITTIFGLAPLVFIPGEGTELYRGVGAIVLFGILGAAVVSLTMLPALTISVLKWNDRRKAPLAKAT